jgi:hypothetical protein
MGADHNEPERRPGRRKLDRATRELLWRELWDYLAREWCRRARTKGLLPPKVK